MGSVDGTSIHVDYLACTWKVEMKRKDNIKEKGVSETGGSKRRRKITVAFRTDFVIKFEKKYIRTDLLELCQRRFSSL